MENFKGTIREALEQLNKLENKYLHYKELDEKYNGDLISIKIEMWNAKKKWEEWKKKLEGVNINF